MTPYNEHKADVLKRLATSRQSGLTSEEAQARLTQQWPQRLGRQQAPTSLAPVFGHLERTFGDYFIHRRAIGLGQRRL
ncbi:cation-transporting ATPase, E1-E2 family protein [Lactiplantibacillus paraplantarum]|nr:cation-transporting ATPase, E1-E2 family protein [Lactiplantibacillus paraplantarum]